MKISQQKINKDKTTKALKECARLFAEILINELERKNMNQQGVKNQSCKGPAST